MTQYDFVWLCMTLYDYVWLCMTMYDFVWPCTKLRDTLLLWMTLYDPIQRFITPYDYVCLCKTLLDTVWLCMALYDSECLCWNHFNYIGFLLYLTLFDFIWLYLNLFDSVWLYLILFCSVWLCWFHLIMFDLGCLCLTLCMTFHFAWILSFKSIQLCINLLEYIKLCLTLFSSRSYE